MGRETVLLLIADSYADRMSLSQLELIVNATIINAYLEWSADRVRPAATNDKCEQNRSIHKLCDNIKNVRDKDAISRGVQQGAVHFRRSLSSRDMCAIGGIPMIRVPRRTAVVFQDNLPFVIPDSYPISRRTPSPTLSTW